MSETNTIGYYSQDGAQEVRGEWHGKGATMLGLKGEVTKESFHALCDNRHPETGEQITARTKANRRILYDFTFSLPKDASLLWSEGDTRIPGFMRDSAKEVMDHVERDMQARVRVDGKDENRPTGNMVWADHLHTTARPVDGVPDPQLHIHCTVFNATYDDVEGKWKAGQFGGLKADGKYYEAMFHALMAHKMKAHGYEIERDGDFWKVAGIERETAEKFSNRTALIEKQAKDKGIANAAIKAELGARTREKKAGDLTLGELRPVWRQRLTTKERVSIAGLIAEAQESTESGGVPAQVSGREAMAHAVAHEFTRASVVRDRKLMETAMRYGAGDVLPEDAAWQMRNPDHEFMAREVGGKTLVTTREALEEEQAMLAWARDGRDQCWPLGGYDTPPFSSTKLTRDQENAGRYLLTSQSRVMVVNGAPGVGKTTLFAEVVPVMERQSGLAAHFYAPSASASRGTLRKAGFQKANTVEHLLRSELEHHRIKDGILIIDEASQLSTHDMLRVFRLADAQNCRVVLSGDMYQHGAIERGDAMRLVMADAVKGMELQDIVRQKGEYREAVSLIREGKGQEAFDRIDRMGWVSEIPEAEAMYAMVAQDYAWHTRAGKSFLAVAPTHAEGRDAASAIREELRKEGRIGYRRDARGRKIAVEDRTFFTLRGLHWTEAQKADGGQYQPGQVVQFHQNAPGIGNGSRWLVDRIEGRTVHLIGADGRERQTLPVKHADRFEVYAQDTLSATVGDVVRVTRQGTTPDGFKLENGSVHTIQGFTPAGDIMLEHGRVMPQDYAHMATAYYATSYAAQSMTVDRVALVQSSRSFAAASQEQFLVSASRGREQVRIYTDDKDALREYLQRSAQRGGATELMAGTLAPNTQPVEAWRAREAQLDANRHTRARKRREAMNAAMEQEQQRAVGMPRAAGTWKERTRDERGYGPEIA